MGFATAEQLQRSASHFSKAQNASELDSRPLPLELPADSHQSGLYVLEHQTSNLPKPLNEKHDSLPIQSVVTDIHGPRVPACLMCNQNLLGLTEQKVLVHANACLDSAPTPLSVSDLEISIAPFDPISDITSSQHSSVERTTMYNRAQDLAPSSSQTSRTSLPLMDEPGRSSSGIRPLKEYNAAVFEKNTSLSFSGAGSLDDTPEIPNIAYVLSGTSPPKQVQATNASSAYQQMHGEKIRLPSEDDDEWYDTEDDDEWYDTKESLVESSECC